MKRKGEQAAYQFWLVFWAVLLLTLFGAPALALLAKLFRVM